MFTRFLVAAACAPLLSLPGCGSDDGSVAAQAGGPGGFQAGGPGPMTGGGPGVGSPGGGSPAGLTPGGMVDQSCAAVRKDASVAAAAVDVIWVIDNSASMIDELARVQSNLSSFISAVGQAGDVRVVMLTAIDPAAGTPLGADATRYKFVGSNVDSKMLYATAIGSFGSYGSFLRPGAPTHVVMVTDDNDLVPGALFKQQMEAQLGHPFTLHAIASESVNGRPCANPICGGIPIPTVCGAAAPGTAYYEVAQQTQGETLSICTEDWTMVFGRLQSAVIASVPLPCDYEIPSSGATLDVNAVQVVYTDPRNVEQQFPRAGGVQSCAANVAWYYDNPQAPARIKLCPAACTVVQGGGSMDIAFGCAPILL